MKKIFALLLALAILSPSMALAKKNDQGLVPEYQAQGAGMTTDNSRQVIISILSTKKDVTDADLAKAAVHAVLFRDYDDMTNSGYGSVVSQKSLLDPTVEKERVDFFEPFFKNGDYMNYVQVVSDSRRVLKSGKLFKISAKVRVNATALSKLLQKQGIRKNLSTGW